MCVCLPSYVLTASRFMTWRIMWYSSEMPFPPNMSRACLAISSDLPQLFLFSMEIISGATLFHDNEKEKCCYCSGWQRPKLMWKKFKFRKRDTHFFSSMSLPRARHECRPMEISVSMSAIFFCISWFLASGTPNWILIGGGGYKNMKDL